MHAVEGTFPVRRPLGKLYQGTFLQEPLSLGSYVDRIAFLENTTGALQSPHQTPRDESHLTTYKAISGKRVI